MIIINSKEFRANQGKYLAMVNSGEDIILNSRSQGCFRIMPILNNDELTPKEKESIKKGLEEFKQRKTTLIKDIDNVWESIL